MSRTHFAVSAVDTACGRSGRATSLPGRVTCLVCQKSAAYAEAKVETDRRTAESIAYGTPRLVLRSFATSQDGAYITCRRCGGGKFLPAGRSLDYFDWMCPKDGQIEHTLTETGMSA